MKKFKQFRAEQQYIAEVGPFASAMMGAMGVIGLGVAGWKLFKAGKEKIKGYRETKAEKKDNKESGVFVKIKKWDDKAGKLKEVTVEIAAAGSSKANMSNEDIEKERKKLQKKEDPKNTAAQNAYDTAEQEAEDERDGIEDVKDAEAAYKNSNENEKDRKAPPGWQNVGTKQEPQLMTTRDAEKELARRVKVGDPDLDQMQKDADDADTKAKEDERKEQEKLGDAEMKARADAEKEKEDEEEPETTDDDETKDDEDEVEKDKDGNIKNQDDAQAAFEKGDFKKAPSGWTKDPEDETGKTVIKPEDIKKKQGTQGKSDAPKGALTKLAKGKKLTSQNILSFGEFITEGVMKDLLKAGKSKKDSEITLDDGADIPIDPLTSQILVKYIEGLSSSEKNRTIQQIQRTERAFMKVLGKAHENI